MLVILHFKVIKIAKKKVKSEPQFLTTDLIIKTKLSIPYSMKMKH